MIAPAPRLFFGLWLGAAALLAAACGSTPREGVRPIDKGLPDESSMAPLPARASLPERARVVALDVGKSHACAVLVSGKVACWGNNRDGQLGVALPRASAVPLLVADVDRVTAIEAGDGISCARRGDQRALCWGKGGGIVSIPGTERATDLVVSDGGGPFDACALGSDGAVSCWDLPEAIPTRVPSLAKSTSLVLGRGLVCGVASGQAKCVEPTSKEWLRESPPDASAVSLTLGVPDLVELSISNDRLCGRAGNGKISCQDRRSGDYHAFDAPKDASALTIVRGGVCVVGADHAVRCFDDQRGAALNPGFGAVTLSSLACEGDLCCGVTDAGGAVCRGFNEDGQLGDGSPLDRVDPTLVEGVTGVTALDASTATCALGANGEVRCWGEEFSSKGEPHVVARDVRALDVGADLAVVDAHGAVTRWQPAPPRGCPAVVERPEPCDGAPTWAATPTPTLGAARIVRATTRGDLCALTDTGRLACLLQDGPRSAKRWSLIAGVEKATALAAGYDSVCAVTEKGRVACARFGLGDPSSSASRSIDARDVTSLDTVQSITATPSAFYVGRADGTVARFRLGEETIRIVPLPALSGLTHLSARGGHACGVRKGEVLCFSTDDAALDKEKPKSVALPRTPVDVAAGTAHACALVEGGQVFCWGSDRQGQLGAGRIVASPTLRPVSGLGPS